MTQKTSLKKGKKIDLPVQKLSLRTFKAKSKALKKGDNSLPRSLVLQIEIDLNAVLKNKYCIVGYFKFGSGKNTKFSKKISIPKVKGPETKLELPADLLTFGDIEIPFKKLIKSFEKNRELIFTPFLYRNPHLGYDINGEAFYPSPPAAPN
jgi:hypothetical protein